MIRSFILVLLLGGAPVAAAITPPTQGAASFSVDVAQDPPDSQPVGTPLQWTVTSSSSSPMSYRLSVERADGANEVFIDYRSANVFEWAPSGEGAYVVRAWAKDENTGEVAEASKPLNVISRVKESPVVTLTDHPLVALFSAPPCPAGLHMRVLFKTRDAPTPDATPTQPCDGETSMNFYVAGLVRRWRHMFRAELLKNEIEPFDHGPELSLLAGPAKGRLPDRRTTRPPTANASVEESVLLQSPATKTVLAGGSATPVTPVPYASDLEGRVLWYYTGDPNRKPALMQPVPGGTLLINLSEDDLEGQVFREIDLIGNVVRETNRKRVSEQLVAMGHDAMGAFHHDALRLPNGHTAVITSVERVLEGVQGPEPVDVLGDMIVVLDQDWQVAWVWNAFDHLDVRRRATLNEKCKNKAPGCPPFFLAEVVNDWTHTNTITYSPADGNLLFSVRNQDWIVKVDYRDGAGNGDVIWRLGPEGDFSLESSDPYPWLSHQHDPRYVDRDHLVVYDNGNTRCRKFPKLCYSRGQVYHLDESNRVATLTLNFNLTSYSFALGSSQPLMNGNFHFNSGIEKNEEGRFVATSDEVDADGSSFVYAHLTEAQVYRSWRLVDLYMSTNTSESMAYAQTLFDNSPSN